MKVQTTEATNLWKGMNWRILFNIINSNYNFNIFIQMTHKEIENF